MTEPSSSPTPNTSDRSDAAGEKRARVLIVDDIFDNRAILGRRFERRGFEVIEADSGARALELIAEQAFDVVLLDWMMPDLDGMEVLRRIRATLSPVELPVIMVTAKSQNEDVVEALTLGANDYMTKPVDFGVALARVQTQVGRKRAEEQVLAANEALSRSNEDLERRIAERTVELVETNQQLRVAVEKAEAANRAKDEFLSTMSHELRTPLNGVIGMAQVLATTELTPPQQEMLEVIDTSAQGLQDIVADLLDIVDLSSGRLELSRQKLNLGALVREAAAPWQAQAQQKGLGFKVTVASGSEGEVQVDPARLRQILSKLLSNAVKFTEAGEIELTVDRLDTAASWVAFDVRDTGVGFDPAAADRLFARFEQADNSVTRRFGGVGLGLAICQELVHQMAGTITAKSVPGEGATFRVQLPLPAIGSTATGPGEDAPDPAAGASALRVLCVEDHPINRKVMQLIMDAAGVTMTAVENGAEAVETCKSERFDVILMDMQMPVMDGLTATRAIRAFEAHEGRTPTPILMVTAHGFPEHVAASAAAGADRHLTKPVNAGELIGLIRQLTASAEQAPPAAAAAG